MNGPLSSWENRLIEPFYIVGFDPGGTTGWASVALHQPTHLLDLKLSDISLLTGQFGPGEHYEELYDFVLSLVGEPKAELVCEPFTYRQHAIQDGVGRGKVELISAEYIGVITLVARRYQLPLYLGFNAGQALSLISNKKLELMGWLQTPATPMRHRNDAIRQVVKYLIIKKKINAPITSTWRN